MKKTVSVHNSNHERWLISYADFITLLFAFFVVMFATAQKDKSKASVVAESVRDAIQHGQLTSALTGILNHTRTPPPGQGDSRQHPPAPPLAGSAPPNQAVPRQVAPPASEADLVKSLETLHAGLEPELDKGKVSLGLDQRGLVISLREAAFFDSGEASVSAASYPIMQKIAKVVATLPYPLRLEGHTDSVPIHNARFRSNWELSTARGIAVLELLHERFQFPNERMSVAGYAENAPADTNQTEEGRAHNRRVDLVVLSPAALTGEPRATLAAK